MKFFKSVNLTEGNILKQLLLFSIPLLLSNLLQQLYNTVDLLIVGRYAGKAAMAGVGSTGALCNMLVGLFMGIAMGTSVKTAQYFGAEDYDGLYKTVHSAIGLALSSGAVLTVLGIAAARQLLIMMKTPTDVMPEALIYIRIFFIGIIPLLVYNVGAGILRAAGDSQRPFNFLIVSAVSNILLDLIFVKKLGMGAGGVAAATVISQVISMVLVIVTLVRSTTPYRLFLKDIKVHIKEAEEIFSIGVPAGLQAVVISLSNVLIQSKINGFGSDCVAGISAASRIDGFIFAAFQAVALAMTTFAGQNLGAKKYRRLHKGTRIGIGLAMAVAAVLAALTMIFLKPLLALFNDDPAVIAYGIRMVRVLAPTYIIFSASEVLAGVIRGSGKALPPMLSAMINMCGMRMLWLYAVLPFRYSIDTVVLSYPVSWVLTLTSNLLYYRLGRWLPGKKTLKEFRKERKEEKLA